MEALRVLRNQFYRLRWGRQKNAYVEGGPEGFSLQVDPPWVFTLDAFADGCRNP